MTICKNLVSAFTVAAAAFLAGCGEPQSAKPADVPDAPAVPKAPLVQTRQAADWCGEHGVPESICTRCDATLIAGFKAKGDWCEAHGVPTSQCFACDPALEAKFEALAPTDSR